MGNSRLCHIKGSCKITDTNLTLKQHVQNSDTTHFTKNLKQFCKSIKFFKWRHFFLHNFQKILMNLKFITAFIFFINFNTIHLMSRQHLPFQEKTHVYFLYPKSTRIALSTARTITPTSAKIANHIPEKPRAPRTRHNSLIPIANTMFS